METAGLPPIFRLLSRVAIFIHKSQYCKTTTATEKVIDVAALPREITIGVG